MSCCGARSRAPANVLPQRHVAPAAEAQRSRATVPFEYVGATRLVADGPVTRQRYRFEHPGAVVEVDDSDAASFAAIPNLKRRRG